MSDGDNSENMDRGRERERSRNRDGDGDGFITRYEFDGALRSHTITEHGLLREEVRRVATEVNRRLDIGDRHDEALDAKINVLERDLLKRIAEGDNVTQALVMEQVRRLVEGIKNNSPGFFIVASLITGLIFGRISSGLF